MVKRIWQELALFWHKCRNLAGGASGRDGGNYIEADPLDEILPPGVFSAELNSINERRRGWGIAPATGNGGAPNVRYGLAGLALSGGGIRSATFNLGVLQALERKDLLPRMDYLSTVSGGGYLGGCLSSSLATAPDAADMDVILSGVPGGAGLSGGVLEDDDTWRLSGEDCASVTLTLPCTGDGQTVRLSASMATRDGRRLPAQVRPRLPFPRGIVAVTEKSVRGEVLKIIADADAAASGVSIPLAVVLDCFPFHHDVGVPEGAAFRHLRDNSNYLTPRKFLAGLRLPALLLRGVLINFLILLPLLLAASLATLWIAGGDIREALLTEERTVRIDADAPSLWLVSSDEHANRFDLDLDVLLAGSTPLPERFDFIAVSGFGTDVWPASADHSGEETVVVPATAPVLPLVLRTAAAPPPDLAVKAWKEAAGTEGGTGVDPVTALGSRIFVALRWLAVAALGVLALYPVVQWLVEGFAGPSWSSRDWLTRYLAGGVVLAAGVLSFVLIQPLAMNWLHELGKVRLAGLGDGAEVMTMAGALLIGIGILFSGPLATRAAGLIGRIGLMALAAAGPLLVWLVYLNLCRWVLVPATAPAWLLTMADSLTSSSGAMAAIGDLGAGLAWLLEPVHDGWRWTAETGNVAAVYGGFAVLAFAVTRLFYDVNATSFHRFYRDRLSKAYLIDPWTKEGQVRHNDNQFLSALDESRAPYHLVNTTLNIQTSKDANLRGRNGAFFMMSRNFVGSPLTGYRATEEMEDLHPDLDLGTAVAISGAAAAPNMGAETHKALTFVLTLLNVRLGYWLPHPGSFSARAFRIPVVGGLARLLLSPFTRVTPIYLLKEMLGQLDEKGRHINLSDGGHLENLGVYELLRRRCRLIIACDGEADPEMTFKGLANMIRMARIDLGVNIEIDVDCLRPGSATGWSAAHGAIGRIHYGGGDYGYLVYIKSSMTGDEPVSIRKYRDDDPAFPHQTTADQFFDEAQFEAYRALGYHVGEAMLDDALVGSAMSSDLGDFVARVAARYHGVRETGQTAT